MSSDELTQYNDYYHNLSVSQRIFKFQFPQLVDDIE